MAKSAICLQFDGFQSPGCGNRLSTEAERLRTWFAVPLSFLPSPRSRQRLELQSFVLDVNHLIARRVERLLPWHLLEGCFPPATLEELRELFTARFAPLWDEKESVELRQCGPAQVREEWLRRSRNGAWEPGLRTILDEADLPRIWSELNTGDFDLTGRGRDYTEGMHYFQAARALGVETLLEHLGAFDWKDGFILDVLGGDGYILRIFEAVRKLRNLPLCTVECNLEGLRTGRQEVTGAGRQLVEQCGGVLLLALEGTSGVGDAQIGRWIAALPGGVTASAPLAVPVDDLETLRRRARAIPPSRDVDNLLEQASKIFSDAGASCGGPLIITNDISPHMFFSAGRWGLPTREDASQLSRTFRAGALDAVIFAYGTHHVSGISQAIHEAAKILRPGGRILLQDFLDEGAVGNWFHKVVDAYSRTGHDFFHMGPIQLAVQLLLAGFREVRMFEMEDPFMFAVPPGAAAGARDIACTYLLGMYGLGESHLRERHCLEGQIRQILSYEEIGNTPEFEEDFVYIPRRATGVSAVRPHDSGQPLSPVDRALVQALTGVLALEPVTIARRFGATPELLSSWFRDDGARWGLAAWEVAAWFQQVESWLQAD